MIVSGSTVTNSDGSASNVLTVPVVTPGRVEQVGNNTVADIPLVTDASGKALLALQVPVGYGLQASGSGQAKPAGNSLTDLIREIKAHTTSGSPDQDQLTGGGTGFLGDLNTSTPLLVQTIVPTGNGSGANSAPLTISGQPQTTGQPQTALVIDTRTQSSIHIELQNVEFAAIIGNATVSGGSGSQHVWGDSASQTIFLGADDDELHGGGGNDVVGSRTGDDKLHGDDGNDVVIGGIGNDTLEGGNGDDVLQGGASDAGRWTFALGSDGRLHSRFAATQLLGAETASLDRIGAWAWDGGRETDARLQFSFESTERLATVASLHQAVLGRLPTLAELNLYSTLPATEQQLATIAFDAFRAAHAGFDSAPVATQVRLLVEAAWGTGAATQALLPAAVDYISHGGSWADGLLYLANAPRGRAAITSNGQLNLTQPYAADESGWDADTGNDVLRGGAGNDRLVGGRGNDLLDGGTGTDRAVFFGSPQDMTVHTAVVDGQPALVFTHGGEVDTLIGIEQFEIGGRVYGPAPAMATLVAGQEYPLASLLVELTGVATAG